MRTAKKAYVEGIVMDPAAIGSKRAVPFNAIEDILARDNPRGYLRAAVAFSRSLDSSAARIRISTWGSGAAMSPNR